MSRLDVDETRPSREGGVVTRMWRWCAVGTVIAAMAVSATLFAQTPPPAAGATRALSEEETREAGLVLDLIDAVAGGQTAPNDFSMSWAGETVMKAQGNRQYVPFTVTLDSAAIGTGPVTLYWRVSSKTPPAAAPATPPAAGAPAAAPAPAPAHAYEDLQITTLPAQTGRMRISRSFLVPGGNYDVHVVAKHASPATPDPAAAAPKVSYIVQPVEVPDFWNNEFATSSVILAERLEPLATQLTPQQMRERPYVLGTIEIIPAVSPRYAKSGELTWFFFVYNARADSGNKPNVVVEYNFHTKDSSGAEKFFNKMAPQELNAQTLPKEFNLAAGHQLQTGQALPLSSFPEGDYRLEIKITDRLADKSVIRNVNFTIGG